MKGFASVGTIKVFRAVCGNVGLGPSWFRLYPGRAGRSGWGRILSLWLVPVSCTSYSYFFGKVRDKGTYRDCTRARGFSVLRLCTADIIIPDGSIWFQFLPPLRHKSRRTQFIPIQTAVRKYEDGPLPRRHFSQARPGPGKLISIGSNTEMLPSKLEIQLCNILQ